MSRIGLVTLDHIEGDLAVKARVQRKGNVNNHAKGKLFKVDLIDDSAELNNVIEVCFYTAETDLFYDKI